MNGHDTHATPRKLAWTGVIAGSLVFLALAWLVRRGSLDGFDRSLLLAMRHADDRDRALGPEWLREAAAEWTALGGYPIMAVLCLVAIVGFALAGRRRAAFFATVSLAGGALVSSGLKLLFARPRPDLVEHLDKIFTSSFPSAHAMMSTVTYLTLAAMLATVVERCRVTTFAFAVAGAIAVLVGVSRVYLGVHWPTDVVAGWGVGVAWASACWLVADRLRATRTIEEPMHMRAGATGA